MILSKVQAKEGTVVKLLGYDQNLDWFNSTWGLNIVLTDGVLQNLPCSYAWVFRFEEDQSENDTK